MRGGRAAVSMLGKIGTSRAAHDAQPGAGGSKTGTRHDHRDPGRRKQAGALSRQQSQRPGPAGTGEGCTGNTWRKASPSPRGGMTYVLNRRARLAATAARNEGR